MKEKETSESFWLFLTLDVIGAIVGYIVCSHLPGYSIGASIGKTIVWIGTFGIISGIVQIGLKVSFEWKARKTNSRKPVETRDRLRIEIRETANAKREAARRVAELEEQEAKLRVQYAEETGETDAYRNGADAIPTAELKRFKA